MLTDEELKQACNKLNEKIDFHQQWKVIDNKLAKTFKFDSFVYAFNWMIKVANIAEQLNHHPEWCNNYNRVHVKLITHDAKGITKLDFELAEKMQSLYIKTDDLS